MPLLSEIRGPQYVWVTLAAMTGATVDNEVLIPSLPFNATILGAQWIPSAAVTASGTNFSVLSVRNRGQAGAGTALPVTRSYAATNSVAFVGEAMTLSATATDLQIAANDVLTAQMIHTAAGVVIPAGFLRLAYQGR